MADATISSLEVKDGVLHIYGANYTQTTTTVYVDDTETAHSYVSATELTLDPAPDAGLEIEVEKAGVRSAAVPVPSDASVPAEGETAPAATEIPPGGSEGNTGQAPVGQEDFLREQDKIPPQPMSAAKPVEQAQEVPPNIDYGAGGEEAAPGRQQS